MAGAASSMCGGGPKRRRRAVLLAHPRGRRTATPRPHPPADRPVVRSLGEVPAVCQQIVHANVRALGPGGRNERPVPTIKNAALGECVERHRSGVTIGGGGPDAQHPVAALRKRSTIEHCGEHQIFADQMLDEPVHGPIQGLSRRGPLVGFDRIDQLADGRDERASRSSWISLSSATGPPHEGGATRRSDVRSAESWRRGNGHRHGTSRPFQLQRSIKILPHEPCGRARFLDARRTFKALWHRLLIVKEGARGVGSRRCRRHGLLHEFGPLPQRNRLARLGFSVSSSAAATGRMQSGRQQRSAGLPPGARLDRFPGGCRSRRRTRATAERVIPVDLIADSAES